MNEFLSLIVATTLVLLIYLHYKHCDELKYLDILNPSVPRCVTHCGGPSLESNMTWIVLSYAVEEISNRPGMKFKYPRFSHNIW